MNKRGKCHLKGVVADPLDRATELRRLFVNRLKEVMGENHLSMNALALRCKGKVGYASINRILNGKQDPTLDKIHAIAEAVGLPAWFLLTEKDQVEQRVIRPPQNVVTLPRPYPKIFGDKSDPALPKPRPAAKRSGKK